METCSKVSSPSALPWPRSSQTWPRRSWKWTRLGSDGLPQAFLNFSHGFFVPKIELVDLYQENWLIFELEPGLFFHYLPKKSGKNVSQGWLAASPPWMSQVRTKEKALFDKADGNAKDAMEGLRLALQVLLDPKRVWALGLAKQLLRGSSHVGSEPNTKLLYWSILQIDIYIL